MKILEKIWNWIKKVLFEIEEKVEKYTPIAVNIVQLIKRAVESNAYFSVTEIVKAVIPGETDDRIIDMITAVAKEYIPKIALQLRIITEINQFVNTDEKVFAVIQALQNANDEQKSDYWHELATFILRKLTDGKITLGEAAAIVEYHYQNYIKIK